MEESFFKNSAKKIKATRNTTNITCLKEIEKSKFIFDSIGINRKVHDWTTTAVCCSNKKRINIFFDKKYIDYLNKNEIIDKLGRIKIELDAIQQAFDYVDQFLFKKQKHSIPDFYIFRYFYNMSRYFIYIKLRSLIDKSVKSDDATLYSLLQLMSQNVYGPKIKFRFKRKYIEIQNDIDSASLLNSFDSVLKTTAVQNFITNTNKIFKHITTKMSNKNAEWIFIKINMRKISELRLLYILFNYLKNHIYKPVLTFFLPGNDVGRYPQYKWNQIRFTQTEYCSIFNTTLGPNSFNTLLKFLKDGIGAKLNKNNKNTN